MVAMTDLNSVAPRASSAGDRAGRNSLKWPLEPDSPAIRRVARFCHLGTPGCREACGSRLPTTPTRS